MKKLAIILFVFSSINLSFAHQMEVSCPKKLHGYHVAYAEEKLYFKPDGKKEIQVWCVNSNDETSKLEPGAMPELDDLPWHAKIIGLTGSWQRRHNNRYCPREDLLKCFATFHWD